MASAKTSSWGSQGAKVTGRQALGWSSNLSTCVDPHTQAISMQRHAPCYTDGDKCGNTLWCRIVALQHALLCATQPSESSSLLPQGLHRAPSPLPSPPPRESSSSLLPQGLQNFACYMEDCSHAADPLQLTFDMKACAQSSCNSVSTRCTLL